MLLIYQRGGNVAKSKFDFSLLTPVDESNSEFQKNLQPIEEELPEDEGAYLDTLPEPEGFWKKLPRNILIGLTHAGRNLHNLPHDIAQGFESGTKDIGATINQLKGPKIKQTPISESLPYDTNDYSDVFGQEGDPTLMDSLIQGGIEHAPEIIGGTGLLRGGLRRLKGTHQLDAIEKIINKEGLAGFNYPNQMIEEAKKFLPPTNATKELISEVNSGKYSPAFKLQSQIGHHQRKLSKSPLASENSIMAPKAGELKQNMLDHLESVLRSSNHTKEADLLRTGINNYRQYKKVMDAALPIIKYLGIPTTILTSLGFGYKQGKKLLKD